MAVTATKTSLQTYLRFEAGRAREAMERYRDIFGGELDVMTIAGSPIAGQMPPEKAHLVMHSRLQVGSSAIMGADMMMDDYEKPAGFCVSVGLADETEARRIFGALAEGGTIDMPLEETFWSPMFGMVTDRFGTPWMINVA